MKQRKEFQRPEKKPSSNKTIQELTHQITHIIGKNPDHAAKAIENWVKEPAKTQKKAS